jgi:hypothetical protein
MIRDRGDDLTFPEDISGGKKAAVESGHRFN